MVKSWQTLDEWMGAHAVLCALTPRIEPQDVWWDRQGCELVLTEQAYRLVSAGHFARPQTVTVMEG